MHDLIFVVIFLATCTSIGWGITSRCVFEGRYFAAPVVGLGIIATVSTLAYRYGASVKECTFIILAIAVLGAVSSAGRVVKDLSLFSPTSAIITALVGLLAIIPDWIGGEQFFSFQINPVDQVNYLKATTAYSIYGYDTIKHPPEWWHAAGNMFDFATLLLDMRPGVNIVQGAFMWPMFKTAIEAYPPYMASLQVLMALAVGFIVLQISPRRYVLAATVGAVFAIGPLFQHTVDLNAWSQTAGMPVAFVAIGMGFVVLSSAKSDPWSITALAVALAGVLFLYPEIATIVAVGGVAAALAHVVATQSFRQVWPAVVASVGALLIAALYWDGTLGFLHNQISWTVKHPYFDWAIYYDHQLAGRDVNYSLIFSQNIPFIHYEKASSFIDPAMGSLGLFYLLPTPDTGINARALWKALTVFGMIWLAVSAVMAAKQKTAVWPLVAGLLACLVIPAYAILQGYFWTAGKALGMAAPALFILAALPLALRTKWFWRIPALVVILAHLSFVVVRMMAANGEPYPQPYPQAPMKPAVNWSIIATHQALKACKGIHLNIQEPILDSYIQAALTGYKIKWQTLQAIRPSYDVYPPPVFQKTDPAECLITDIDPINGYKMGLDLRRKGQ